VGRETLFIASSFQRAPLTMRQSAWGMIVPGYDYNPLTARYTHTHLERVKANVSTYEHYDAVKKILATRRALADIEAYPNYAFFTAVAANDAGANLKTAYWLAVANDVLDDPGLKASVEERLAFGKKDGLSPDAQNRIANIRSTYEGAFRLLEKVLTRSNSTAEVPKDALQMLRAGTDRGAVAARVTDARQRAEEREERKEEEGAKLCRETKLNLIPGYCAVQEAGETAAKVIRYGAFAAVAIASALAIHRTIKKVRSNPHSTSYNPDGKKPMPRAAKQQERRLASTVFSRGAR